MKYHFIAIEGNIGAGKTTLARQLAAHYQATLLLEQFADNPFLPLFYEHKAQYTLPLELSFLTDRYEQLKGAFKQHNPDQLLVADYTIFKSPLFAKNNLNEIEFALYQRIHNLIKTTLPKPDLILYLHTPIEKLQQQIRKRGRAYEQHISADYLEAIQAAYQQYFSQDAANLLWIDNAETDFNRPQDFNRLIQRIEEEVRH
jgi:deoxyguanosine kinase